MSAIEFTNIVSLHRLAGAIAASALVAIGCGSGEAEGPGDRNSGAEWTQNDFVSAEPEAAATSSRRGREPAAYPEDVELEARSSSVRWFRWTKGEPDKILLPHSTHICGLSMVRGQLQRNTSVMVIRIGANWVLRGLSAGSNLLQVDAVCEPFSAFRVDAGRAVAIAGDFVAATSEKNVTRTVAMPANAAPVLTGLVGQFEGSGERARVTFAPVVEVKNGGQEGTHSAFATALSFGLTGTQTPRVNSYFRSGLAVSDGVSYSWNDGHVIVACEPDAHCCATDFVCGIEVAPLADSFCYLSSVSGDFNGADEWVQVFPNRAIGKWTLAMESESGNGVSARASCLAMDQRTGGGQIIR